MEPIEIHDRGRGPEIKGTRITVYDVMDYYVHGWHPTRIAPWLRLSSDEVQVAIDYIEAHRAEVEENYRRIVERSERGNSPEIEAKMLALQPALELKKADIIRRAKLREAELLARKLP